MQAICYAIYYFCKFKKGSPEFWKVLENALSKNRESMSVQQLTRSMLALVMNPRPISESMAEGILGQI